MSITLVKNDLGNGLNEYTVTIEDKTFSQVIQLEAPYVILVDVVNYQLITVPLDPQINSNFQFLELVL